MKSLLVTILVGLMVISVKGQEATEETRVTINPETGDTTFTASLIISETQDITPRNSMLIINPLKFLLFYNLSYFHKVSEQVAMGGGQTAPCNLTPATSIPAGAKTIRERRCSRRKDRRLRSRRRAHVGSRPGAGAAGCVPGPRGLRWFFLRRRAWRRAGLGPV